ncbi:hypothetical protein D6D01_00286, partial [Aureobasidium pullulans]
VWIDDVVGGRKENKSSSFINSVALAWTVASPVLHARVASHRSGPPIFYSARSARPSPRPTYVSTTVMEEISTETTTQRDSSTSESPYAPQPETEASLVLKATANSYPFLVHSTDTLANNRPPNVDNKPLARQKRRRTSPDDQKILEEAYAKNSKPDKATRMDIVSRVALGEKEVQVSQSHPNPNYASTLNPSSYSSPHTADQLEDSSISQIDATQDAETDSTSQDKTALSASQNASTSFIEVPSSQPDPASQDSASKAGYLSNRRNNASFTALDSQDDLQNSQDQPSKRLRKSDSKIRLSMTADGVARVMEGDDLTSSPPRKLPPPVTAGASFDEHAGQSNELYRTNSQISLCDTPGSQESSTGLRRKPSGRSRDSRVWSFFADRGARSELEDRANQETSGDAAEAISLLRQQEKDRACNPLARVPSLKRLNPQTISNEDRAVKRLRQSQSFTAPPPSSAPSAVAATPFRQPLMQRSSSARNMQSTNRRPAHHDPLLLAKTPKLKQTPTFEISATDSDKENWSPGDRPSAFMDRHFLHQMQTSPAVMPSTVKRPRAHAGFHETPAPRNRGKHSGRTQVAHLDDDDDEDDEDVMQFMNAPPSSSVRKDKAHRAIERDERQSSEEEDLNCVEGLLKLSQGNWGGAAR